MVVKFIRILCLMGILSVIIPGVSGLQVVSTTAVLWDPIQYIGGEKVEAIYIADPTICPHVQADIVPNRIQMEMYFIRDTDLFVAHNGSVDREFVMPYVTKFMEANNFGTVDWVTLENPSMVWNTPEGARELSREVAGWLISADPENKPYYENRLAAYLDLIDAADLTPEERDRISGQDVVVMIWQEEAAIEWLGLNKVSVFAPEFYERGRYTPRAVVNDVYSNPEKYRNVRYVIENMQSDEMAKGLEEALRDNGINAERVIFTNFPKSLPGVDSLPDVIRYNKGLVTPKNEVKGTAPAQSGSPPVAVTVSLLVSVSLLLYWRRDN